MTLVLNVALGLAGLAFACIGLGWMIAPALLGAQFDMALLTGAGLSTQIGDLASFFLTLGTCMALGAATGNRLWLAPPAMLLGFAVIGRLVAWLFHGASLPLQMLVVEGVALALLLAVARQRG